MDSCPWSPVSNCSEAESCYGQQGKPGTYLIVKMSSTGTFDYSSSSKEVVKIMPEKIKIGLEDVIKIAHQRNHPDVSNHYAQMLKECDALYLRDPNQEDVKDLRHFIPLFRKIDYIPKEDIEKKFKLKAMWSEKPGDWPRDVSHVDPNNPGAINGKKILKPKKPELIKMFNHLTQKYKNIREDLWMDTFSCRPDEDPVDIKSQFKEEMGGLCDEFQNLADQVIQIYGEKPIEKLVKALTKELDTIDSVRDPKMWVVYNRQKSILEADIREAIFMHHNGTPHTAPDFIIELKEICRHLSINPDEVLAVYEEDEMAPIPLILDQARSPTNGSRKRKPTFNMNMEEVTMDSVPEVANNFTSFEDTPIFMEDMEVGNNVDVSHDAPEPSMVTYSQVDAVEQNTHNYILEGEQAVQALEQAYPPPAVKLEPAFSVDQLNPSQPVSWDFNTEKLEPVSSLQEIFGNLTTENTIQLVNTSEQVTSPDANGTLTQILNYDALNDIFDILRSDPMLSSTY